MIAAKPAPYPVAWPEGVERTKRPISGPFKTTLHKAVQNVDDALRRFASDSGIALKWAVVTSNKEPLSNRQPDDKAVAAWFEWDGDQRCIAVDRYDKIEHNVQAIYHIIEARRTELRHGGLSIIRQTFKGFTGLALPSPENTDPPWREVLEFGEGRINGSKVRQRYRELAALHHPDNGGNRDTFEQIVRARDAALASLGETA